MRSLPLLYDSELDQRERKDYRDHVRPNDPSEYHLTSVTLSSQPERDTVPNELDGTERYERWGYASRNEDNIVHGNSTVGRT